jgi:hypothetical protein
VFQLIFSRFPGAKVTYPDDPTAAHNMEVVLEPVRGARACISINMQEHRWIWDLSRSRGMSRCAAFLIFSPLPQGGATRRIHISCDCTGTDRAERQVGITGF